MERPGKYSGENGNERTYDAVRFVLESTSPNTSDW
jgi:hypothetical protein